jgi:hypothetical protein
VDLVRSDERRLYNHRDKLIFVACKPYDHDPYIQISQKVKEQ